MSTSVGRSLGGYRHVVFVVAVLGSLLLIVPFLILVATSWTEGTFALFPPTGFTLQWYADVLTDKKWMAAFTLSLWESALATLIATVLGVAGAIGLTRLRSRLAQRWVRTLFIVPIALPPIAYAVGLYGVNTDLGIPKNTLLTLVLGHALIALPYVFVIVSGGLSRMDPALRPAAWTLGARWPLVLWKVELPALVPYILSGALFAFVVVFDEVVLAVFLLPPGVQTLPLKMLNTASESVSPELTAASTMVSVLAMIVLGLIPVVTGILRRRAAAGRLRMPARVTGLEEGIVE